MTSIIRKIFQVGVDKKHLIQNDSNLAFFWQKFCYFTAPPSNGHPQLNHSENFNQKLLHLYELRSARSHPPKTCAKVDHYYDCPSYSHTRTIFYRTLSLPLPRSTFPLLRMIWWEQKFFFLLLRKWTNPAKNSPLVIPSAKLFSIHHLVLGQSVFTADFPRDFPFCLAQDVVRRDGTGFVVFRTFFWKSLRGNSLKIVFGFKVSYTKQKKNFFLKAAIV